MLLINYSKKAFCWKTQSDLFPETTFLPPSQGREKSWSLVTEFPSERVGFINGECGIGASEMWLCLPMRMTGSLDGFMMSQLYFPSLFVGGIRGSARGHRLMASSRAFTSRFRLPLDPRTVSGTSGISWVTHIPVMSTPLYDITVLSYSHPSKLKTCGLWSR